MNLTGHTILITGGSAGIGLALAEALLARGNAVIVCGRSPERLAAAQRRLPGLHARVCDVADPAARAALSASVLAEFPALDVVIHNAGVMRWVDLQAEDAAAVLGAVDAEVATNLMAPIHLTQLLLPHLQRRPSAAIVTVSSGLAFVPASGAPGYSATKAALHSYTASLRSQLARTGVRVFEVMPPTVETDMSREFQSGKLTPQAFVAATLRGLAAGRREIRVGQSSALYWVSRLSPRLAHWIVDRSGGDRPRAAVAAAGG